MLPSSLAKVLPFTLAVFCQPTSVGLRYGRTSLARGFSWRPGSDFSASQLPPLTPQALHQRISLPNPLRVSRAMSNRQRLSPPRPPIAQTSLRGAGILTCSPSTTPFGLALGPTTPGWIILPQEPSGLRWQDSHLLSRYSFRHSLFAALHLPFRSDFSGAATLPYHSAVSPPSPRLRC